MGTFNKIILCGRVGKEPDQSVSKNGKPVSKFSLATDEVNQGAKETLWLNCTTLGATAETVAKHVHKGDMLLVEGKLTVSKYTDKNMVPQTFVGVLVDRVVLLPKQGGQAVQKNVEAAPVADEWNDDLPF